MQAAAARKPATLSTVRRGICVATVLACLPYLLLKFLWVLGWSVGVDDDGFTDTTRVANLATAGMELVAIAVAVLLVHPRGRRVAPVLVAGPAWIASGLLVPLTVAVVVGTPLQILTGGGNPFASDETMSGWVFGLVYGGFALQAVLLLGGFVLYAADRWPMIAGGEVPAGAGATKPLQDLLSGIFVLGAAGFAVQQVGWAITGGGSFDEPETAQRAFLAAGALLALAAAVAFVGLIRGARLTRLLLAFAWVGTSVTFTNAFNEALSAAAIESGEWGSRAAGPGDRTLTLLVLLCATAGTIGGAMRLVEDEVAGRAAGCVGRSRPTGRDS